MAMLSVGDIAPPDKRFEWTDKNEPFPIPSESQDMAGFESTRARKGRGTGISVALDASSSARWGWYCSNE